MTASLLSDTGNNHGSGDRGGCIPGRQGLLQSESLGEVRYGELPCLEDSGRRPGRVADKHTGDRQLPVRPAGEDRIQAAVGAGNLPV